MTQTLLQVHFEELKKASFFIHDTLSHLKPLETHLLNDSRAMEPYDALASRFERFVDIALNRFFRSVEIVSQGQQSETLRDRLLLMAKIGIISSLDIWLEMRDFRNRIAHEYLPEQLMATFEAIRTRFAAEILLCVQASENFTRQHKEG